MLHTPTRYSCSRNEKAQTTPATTMQSNIAKRKSPAELDSIIRFLRGRGPPIALPGQGSARGAPALRPACQGARQGPGPGRRPQKPDCRYPRWGQTSVRRGSRHEPRRHAGRRPSRPRAHGRLSFPQARQASASDHTRLGAIAEASQKVPHGVKLGSRSSRAACLRGPRRTEGLRKSSSEK